jgi:hypothetical protein
MSIGNNGSQRFRLSWPISLILILVMIKLNVFLPVLSLGGTYQADVTPESKQAPSLSVDEALDGHLFAQDMNRAWSLPMETKPLSSLRQVAYMKVAREPGLQPTGRFLITVAATVSLLLGLVSLPSTYCQLWSLVSRRIGQKFNISARAQRDRRAQRTGRPKRLMCFLA